MNKKTAFPVALTLMCAVAFSVCLNSCEKNDDDSSQEETPISINYKMEDGTVFNLKTLLNWGTTLSDVEKFMANYYPDWELSDDGKLQHDTISSVENWSILYEKNNVELAFVFLDKEGKDYVMMSCLFYGSNDIKQLEDELKRLGFKFKGRLDLEAFLYNDLTYLYLSADEKLEVMLNVSNDDDKYLNISFQPLDKDDLDYLVEENPSIINIYLAEDSCSFKPLLNWDATVADLEKFMNENCPDWEEYDSLKMVQDTINERVYWEKPYFKGNFWVYYYYGDAEGQEYLSHELCYASFIDDIESVKMVLTRNGFVYRGKYKNLLEEEDSPGYVYTAPGNEYVAELFSYPLYDTWSLRISPFDEEYIEWVTQN